MVRLALRELWGRRSFGSFIAVFLGVAFLTGALVLGDTLARSVDGFFAQAYAGTDVVVRDATRVSDRPGEVRGTIDRSVVERVRAVPGVLVAEPVIQGSGRLPAADGTVTEARGPRTAGNWIAGSSDRVTSVSVRAVPGVGQERLAAALRPVLPSGVEAITGTSLADEAADQVGFVNILRAGLVGFAAVVLLVAAFGIRNTFSVPVARRTRSAALLRALGAGRGQVLLLVSAEALVIGLTASLLGLGGGVGVAALLKMLFAGLGPPTQGLVVIARTGAVALLAGVGVTLVAALGPALRSSRAAPPAALRESATERAAPGESRIIIAVTLGAVAAGAVVWGALAGVATMAAAGAVMGGLVVVLSGPVVVGPVASLLGWLRGPSGALARSYVMHDPRRTAGALTALMIGVGVVTLLTVYVASFQATVADGAAGRAAISSVAAPYGSPPVLTRGEYVAAAIGPSLGVVYGMLALAILVALLGIGTTLALSVHERTRELALLHALGATHRQIRSMIRYESVIVSLFGTAAGLLLGLFIGWALVRAGGNSFALPTTQLLAIALTGITTGALAATHPARRASHFDLPHPLSRL